MHQLWKYINNSFALFWKLTCLFVRLICLVRMPIWHDFEGIYVIPGRHVSMPPNRRSGSTHSTGSLEGVTFLAVAIVDKKDMGFLVHMINFTMISPLVFLNLTNMKCHLWIVILLFAFSTKTHKAYQIWVLGCFEIS